MPTIAPAKKSRASTLENILPELHELSCDAIMDVQDTNVVHVGHSRA